MSDLLDKGKRFYWAALGYAVIFFVNLIPSLFANFSLGADSVGYWTMFIPLFEGKPFEVWRGYVLPLYFAVLGKMAGGGYGFFIFFNCALNAFMFMYIIPFLSGGGSVDLSFRGTAKHVANFLLIFVLFRGLFIYTLSDTYALYMCLISVFYLVKFKFAQGEENGAGKNFAYCFLCGLFAYFAYNIRTIYLFAGVAAFAMLFAAMKALKLRKAKTAVLVLAFAAGIAAAALPQAVFNYMHHKAFSPFVKTDSLMLNHCRWGLEYQRFDSYFGYLVYDQPEQSDVFMYFEEPIGRKLLEGAHEVKVATGSNLQAGLYIVRHPFELAGIYFRHFANLLFPCWPNINVMKINNNKAPYAIISLLLVYAFALSLVFRSFKNGGIFFAFLPALVACLFIMPGCIECRFFLSVFVLMSSGLIYNTDAKALWAKTKANAWAVAILFLFFAAMMISQWTMLLMSESEIPIYMLGK